LSKCPYLNLMVLNEFSQCLRIDIDFTCLQIKLLLDLSQSFLLPRIDFFKHFLHLLLSLVFYNLQPFCLVFLLRLCQYVQLLLVFLLYVLLLLELVFGPFLEEILYFALFFHV